MRILLSNDDGVFAPGINALYEEIAQIADVSVVAPDRDRSAAGKSLTLTRPLRTRTLDNGFVMVEGTPTDCVYLALKGLLKEKPDMVIAGINAGANLGDDVLYSGTVAAASEGRFLGYPAIATSLVGPGGTQRYKDAAKVVKQVVQRVIDHPLPADTILNVNIPDLPLENMKGIKVSRLGMRHQSEEMICDEDPRGKTIYWVGLAGSPRDAAPDTDFAAIDNGFVSLTPIQMDLTAYNKMGSVADWVDGLEIHSVVQQAS